MNIYYYYRSTSNEPIPSVKIVKGSYQKALKELHQTFKDSVTPIVAVLKKMTTMREVDNLLIVLECQLSVTTYIGTKSSLESVIAALKKEKAELSIRH